LKDAQAADAAKDTCHAGTSITVMIKTEALARPVILVATMGWGGIRI